MNPLRTHRPRRIAVYWLVAFVLAVPLLPSLRERMAPPGAVAGSESEELNERLRVEFDASWRNVGVAVVSGLPMRVDTDSGRAFLRRMTTALQRTPHVRDIVSPASSLDTMLIGSDGTTAILLAGLRSTDSEALDSLRQAGQTIVDALSEGGSSLQIRWTGHHHFVEELRSEGIAETRRAELRALPITLLVLVWAFGSFTLAAFAAGVALTAVVIALGVTAILAFAFPVSSFVMIIASVIGVALTIDYMLYLNWQQQSSSRLDSAARRVVLTAAVLVALAFAALMIAPTGELRGAAATGGVVAIIAGFAAVSLAPLLRVHTRRAPAERWQAWGRRVTRRPVLALLFGLAPLVLLAWRATTARLDTPLDKWLPANMESVAALAELERIDRNSLVGAARVVLELPEGTTILTPAGWSGLREVSNMLQALPSATSVRSIASIGSGELVVAQHVLPKAVSGAMISANGRSALIDVLPDMRSGPAAASSLVHELRALDVSTIGGLEGSRLIVGGLSAYAIDYAEAARKALPWIVLAVSAATWLLLTLLLRAPIAATKAVVLNLLVSAAAIGAAVLVFQDGVVSVWSGPPIGSILPTVPLIAFGATFGISIDYELFLLAAVRERWLHGADAATSSAQGVAAVGGLITRAAAVMICLFLALAVSSFKPLAMIGFTLGVAVLLDATLVRMVVAPAMMCIAGEWNWWPAKRRSIET